jgi:hypothetical protein
MRRRVVVAMMVGAEVWFVAIATKRRRNWNARELRRHGMRRSRRDDAVASSPG